jgi:hypothetical protein
MSHTHVPLSPLPEDATGRAQVFGKYVRKAAREFFPWAIFSHNEIGGIVNAVEMRFAGVLFLTPKDIDHIIAITRRNLEQTAYLRKQEEEPVIEALNICDELKHQRSPMVRRRASVW